MAWYIELLGALRVRQGDQTLSRFSTRRAGSLLAYLAYHPARRRRREELIELLWPEQELLAAQNSLRVALATLRRLLKSIEADLPSLVIADRHNIWLSACNTDAGEFQAAIRAAQENDSLLNQLPYLQAAVARYQGPLLSDFDEDWVTSERQRLADAYLWALDRLMTASARSRNYEQALDYAHQAVQTDPLRETGCRSLMRLYMALGRPAVALQQYQELQQRLLVELKTTPSAATRAVAEELVAQLEGRAGVHAVVYAQQASGEVNGAAPRAPAPASPQLPPCFTTLFGREEEIIEVGNLLTGAVPAASPGGRPDQAARLITLTGPGGSGKTRLALEVAHRVAKEFEGAVWWTPLADLADARHIINAIEKAMGGSGAPQDDPWQQILAALAGRRALLILDNFEHLLEPGASLVQQLRTRAPSLVLLVTSRRQSGLSGERVFPVLPLAVPRGSHTPEQVMEFASAQIFVDRARALVPDFGVTADNAAAIAALCCRLEGIPLAIELAAGWAQTLPPAAMLQRLDQSYELLVSCERDIPDRHRTIWAAMEWSYRLLRPELQRFLLSLAVFRGGWSLEAMTEICAEPRAPEYLRELQMGSLVFSTTDRLGEPRFRMLEVLREFANRRLTVQERRIARQKHANYFLRFVETRLPLVSGPDSQGVLDRQEVEIDNLRTAIQWYASPESAGNVDLENAELRMVAALSQLFALRGYVTEGRDYLNAALAHRQDAAPTELRARALDAAARLASLQADYAAAETLFTESLALRYALADRRGIMMALSAQSALAWQQGKAAEADRFARECLNVAREFGVTTTLAYMLLNLGEFARRRNEFVIARAYFEEALDMAHRLQSPRHIAATTFQMGRLEASEGNVHAAVILYEEAIALFRRNNDKEGLNRALLPFAELLAERGNPVAAHLHREALAIARQTGNKAYMVRAIEGLAHNALTQGAIAVAGRLFGAAESLRQTLASRMDREERSEHERRVAAARAADTDGAFTSNWLGGRLLSLDQAVALALTEDNDREDDSMMEPCDAAPETGAVMER
jgi:predicted ATPase/DNA-binding SARP family transcriptional activator